ncbi:cytochrome P450 [Streptomyces europaeiscabiei]|uniref:cytochrome P450 n=1 Tax=Streptomyces europaeiscabiei TaxID=146819 RepID=UPI002E1807DE
MDTTGVSAPVRVRAPRGLPLLGHLPFLSKRPLAFFEELRGYGDIVDWRVGRAPAVFLFRPTDIQELLGGVETNFRHADRGWGFKLLLGDGLINTVGADWRRKRALVQPAVRPRQVRSYATTMAECAVQTASQWKPGDRVDVRQEMAALTQRIAVRTLFGADSAGREEIIGRAMEIAQQEVGAELHGVMAMLPPWVSTPGRRRLRAAVAEIDAEVSRLIAEGAADGEERDDLLSRLMAARDENGVALTPKELRDEAVTLYVAGHETTATALTWTWYLLSHHPEVRARLTEELDRVLGGRIPDYEDYQELRYAQQVIKESLRIFPVVWVVTAVADTGASIAGHSIDEGTMVWTSPWATHRDPRWFADPEAFRPERWDENAEPKVPDHAWYPFGGGPRTCLGVRFAMVEAVVVLATIAQRLHLDVGPEETKPQAQFTLQPEGPVVATVREA